MRAIKNSFKGYMARRRLQGLWTTLTTTFKSNDQASFQDKDQALEQFLNCFRTLVEQSQQGDKNTNNNLAQEQTQRPVQDTFDSGQHQIEEDHDDQVHGNTNEEAEALAINEISTVFTHRDELMDLLTDYLKQCSQRQDLNEWQASHLFAALIQTLLIILEDVQQTNLDNNGAASQENDLQLEKATQIQEDVSFKDYEHKVRSLNQAVIEHIKFAEDPTALSLLLKIVKVTLTSSEKNFNIWFTEDGGFEATLVLFQKSTSMSVLKKIVIFLKQQLKLGNDINEVEDDLSDTGSDLLHQGDNVVKRVGTFFQSMKKALRDNIMQADFKTTFQEKAFASSGSHLQTQKGENEERKSHEQESDPTHSSAHSHSNTNEMIETDKVTPEPFQIANEIEADKPYSKVQIETILNRRDSSSQRTNSNQRPSGDNSATLIENENRMQIQKILRERNFYHKLADSIDMSKIETLPFYFQLLDILNTFYGPNKIAAEAAQIFDRILVKIEKDLMANSQESAQILKKCLRVLIRIVAPQKTQKMRNLNAFDYIVSLVQIQIELGSIIFVDSIQSVKQLLKAHPENVISFYKQDGYRLLQKWIDMLTVKDNKCLAALLDFCCYIQYELGDLEIHSMALQVSDILTKQFNLKEDNKLLLFRFLQDFFEDKCNRINQEQDYANILRQFELAQEDLQSTFMNCFSIYQSIQTQSLQANKVSNESLVLLLKALNFQIRTQVKAFDQKMFQTNQIYLYPSSASNNIDTDSIIKQLLNTEQIDLRSDKLEAILKMYLASRIIISIQGTSAMQYSQIFKYAQSIHPSLVKVFLAMLFSKECNERAIQIQDWAAQEQGLLEQFFSQLSCVQIGVVDSLHRISILAQGSLACKQRLDTMIDVQQLVMQDIQIKDHGLEDQLFILQCLLELQANENTCNGSIDSLDFILGKVLTKEEYSQFSYTISESQQTRALVQQKSCNSQNILNELDNNNYQAAGIIASLRISNTLNALMLCMCQSDIKVQIHMVEELINLIKHNLYNQQIVVQQQVQELLFIMIHKTMTLASISRHEQKFYMKSIVQLMHHLLCYGISITEDTLFYNCLYKHSTQQHQLLRFNYTFLESIIDILTTNQPKCFAQLNKHWTIFNSNHFTTFNAYVKLHMNWQSKAMPIFEIKFSQCESGIVFEYHREEKSNGDIITNSELTYMGSESYDFSQDKPSHGNIKEDDYITYLIITFQKQQIKVDLDELIASSVFNPTQFNNWHAQLTDQGFLEVFINGHHCSQDSLGAKISVQLEKEKQIINQESSSINYVKLFANTSVSQAQLLADQFKEESFQILQQGKDLTIWDEYFPNQKLIKTQNTPIKRIKVSQKLVEKDYFQIQLCSEKFCVQLVDSNAFSSTYEGIEDETILNIFQSDHQSQGNLMTLKQFLSTEKALKTAFTMLDYANDDDSFLISLKLLCTILIRNDSKILQLFDNMDGYQQLEHTLTQKIKQVHVESIRMLYSYLMEIACNEFNSSFRLDPQATPRNRVKQPTIDPERIQFIEIMMNLMQVTPVDQSIYFIEMLLLLLKQDSNLIMFRNKLGFKTIFKIMKFFEANLRLQGIYDPLLQLFELFIDAIKRDLYPGSLMDLQEAFEFLLGHQFQDDRMIPHNKSKNKNQERVIIDCLSIIAIHVAIEKDKSDNDKAFSNKLFKLQQLFDYILLLVSYESIEIKEYAIKLFQLLLKMSSQFYNNIKQQKGFDILLYRLTQSLQDNSMRNKCYLLCQTILESMVCKFDNSNDLCPTDNSLVHQIFNNSRVAIEIVQQINETLKRPKTNTIVYFEFINAFFGVLGRLPSDQQRYMCLKELEQIMLEPINMENIQEYHFEEFVYCFQDYQQLLNFNVENLQDLLAKIESTYSTEENQQAPEIIQAISTTSGQDNLAQTKSIIFAMDILTSIVVTDLKKPFFQSKIYQILQNIPSEDFLQLQILFKIVKHFMKNPKIPQDEVNILQNLQRIFINRDQLVEQNANLNLRIVLLINSIAFKSSMEVRNVLKNLKILELRDELIIEHIKMCGQLTARKDKLTSNDCLPLLKALSCFSYETLASKQKFRGDNLCTEYLSLIMLRCYKSIQLNEQTVIHKLQQDLRLNILKDEVLKFEENIQFIDSQLPELLDYIKTNNQQIDQQQIDKFIQLLENRVSQSIKQEQERQEKFKKQRTQKRNSIMQGLNVKNQQTAQINHNCDEKLHKLHADILDIQDNSNC